MEDRSKGGPKPRLIILEPAVATQTPAAATVCHQTAAPPRNQGMRVSDWAGRDGTGLQNEQGCSVRRSPKQASPPGSDDDDPDRECDAVPASSPPGWLAHWEERLKGR